MARNTKTSRPQVDPETMALATAAHTILRQRGALSDEVSLADWICDAIYERACLVLRPALGDDEEWLLGDLRFSAAPVQLETTGRARTLHLR